MKISLFLTLFFVGLKFTHISANDPPIEDGKRGLCFPGSKNPRCLPICKLGRSCDTDIQCSDPFHPKAVCAPADYTDHKRYLTNFSGLFWQFLKYLSIYYRTCVCEPPLSCGRIEEWGPGSKMFGSPCRSDKHCGDESKCEKCDFKVYQCYGWVLSFKK